MVRRKKDEDRKASVRPATEICGRLGFVATGHPKWKPRGDRRLV